MILSYRRHQSVASAKSELFRLDSACRSKLNGLAQFHWIRGLAMTKLIALAAVLGLAAVPALADFAMVYMPNLTFPPAAPVVTQAATSTPALPDGQR
jgi:hypothetical protein